MAALIDLCLSFSSLRPCLCKLLISSIASTEALHHHVSLPLFLAVVAAVVVGRSGRVSAFANRNDSPSSPSSTACTVEALTERERATY